MQCDESVAHFSNKLFQGHAVYQLVTHINLVDISFLETLNYSFPVFIKIDHLIMVMEEMNHGGKNVTFSNYNVIKDTC